MIFPEELREYKERAKKLAESLMNLLREIPPEKWGTSIDIVIAGRNLQSFFHGFGLCVHIGLQNLEDGPRLCFAIYPLEGEIPDTLDFDMEFLNFLKESKITVPYP